MYHRDGPLKPRETVYKDCQFRSRIEARWAVVFDSLDIKWKYEIEHYDFGLKNPELDDEYEFREYLENALRENYYDEDNEVIRDAYHDKYARDMYLPDFLLPELKHWVEIKGKAPNYQECSKARKLAWRTDMPVTILWGYIPDPQSKHWGEDTEIYGGDMNIIAILVLECGIRAMQTAFTLGRRARFE